MKRVRANRGPQAAEEAVAMVVAAIAVVMAGNAAADNRPN